MEECYGERYAQKVEQRLLVYLQELRRALSADTCSGRTGPNQPQPGLITLTQMTNKQHPEDEEETSSPSLAGRKLLLCGEQRPPSAIGHKVAILERSIADSVSVTWQMSDNLSIC